MGEEPVPSFDRVKVAAHDARVDTFVDDLRGGYEANVGEFGSALSGGQRQVSTPLFNSFLDIDGLG